MISELGHDIFHSGFIFFEQHAELLIFMKQGLIFNNNLSIQTFEL